MKAIQIGNHYEIYDDSLKAYDALPAGVYTVRFSKLTGFYLEAHSPLNVKEKIYGVHHEKAQKVIHTYEHSDRSLGVILSGAKGIGKSVFSRMLAELSISHGIPVIIVDSFKPGIASYLESIDQSVMVLFDEFDKTFANIKVGENESDPQAGLLNLFDGTAIGKKLFVITCNEMSRLSDYLLNRPGRFHYHFRFNYPNDSEIREYLQDQLNKEFWGEIDSVISFSKRGNLNYDCLRSIAFELNMGARFKDAILDLNIINTNDELYTLSLYFDNGEVLTKTNCQINMFDCDGAESFWLKNTQGDYIVRVDFLPQNARFEPELNKHIVEMQHVKLTYEDDPDYATEVAGLKSAAPQYLAISRSKPKDIHYAL